MTPGNLGVVAEAGELRHQRNAGARSRCHGARARPACAKHHADGGQFVFRLHDGEGRLAFRRDAELLQQVGGGFNQRCRRRDRIPRHHGDARKHRAHAARGVAVDDDLAGGLVHPLDEVRILLDELFLRVIEARLDRAEVEVEDLLLLGELLAHAASRRP